MKPLRETVCLRPDSDTIAAELFLPAVLTEAPALIVCHGAGEFKENYFELCELLAQKGVAALAMDMHGHGESSGERYCVDMEKWVANVQIGIDFLLMHPAIDAERIGAFGLSSGGTAVLEAAVRDPRLKALVATGATVRNSLPWWATLALKFLILAGSAKKRITHRDLRISLTRITAGLQLASDPAVQRRIENDPRTRAVLTAFPFPGAAQAFFVDTLKRVSRITAPTLVVWGAEDKLDPPETARLLFDALVCKKQLHIVPGNGHAGHLDRNRRTVFALTADWALHNLT
jgi:uncharacterized protein